MKRAALLFLLGTSACAARPQGEAASLHFAVSPPSANVTNVRVLSSRVNLQEPVSLSTEGDDVVVRFAIRGRAGASYRLDPETLDVRAAEQVTFPPHERPRTAPFLRADQSTVTLADRSSLAFVTDDASSRVLVQSYAPDGSLRSESSVSPASMEVVGAPRAATADGRHVVVAFYTSTGVGFDLVAASVETPR
jgi:hypothetical protein